jgi:hypothetical protein
VVVVGSEEDDGDEVVSMLLLLLLCGGERLRRLGQLPERYTLCSHSHTACELERKGKGEREQKRKSKVKHDESQGYFNGPCKPCCPCVNTSIRLERKFFFCGMGLFFLLFGLNRLVATTTFPARMAAVLAK